MRIARELTLTGHGDETVVMVLVKVRLSLSG